MLLTIFEEGAYQLQVLSHFKMYQENIIEWYINMVFPPEIGTLVRKGIQLRAVKGSLLLTITKLLVGLCRFCEKAYAFSEY